MRRILFTLALSLAACQPPSFPTCVEAPEHPQCDLPPGFVDGIPNSDHPEDPR